MTKAAKKWTVAESGALTDEFELGPWATGALSGLTLVVDERFDIEERRTGCGNQSWWDLQPTAATNAAALDLLLFSGAQCLGSSRCDEFGIGLTGESSSFGTPLNPCCPERVPGGSASGAASAVACGLFDLALVTDGGGDAIVTASNCGLVGWRSSHGLISRAGALSMCASIDSIGVMSPRLDCVTRAADSLLTGCNSESKIRRFLILENSSSAMDPAAYSAFHQSAVAAAGACGQAFEKITLAELSGGHCGDFHLWYQLFTQTQYLEVLNSYGAWIEKNRPVLEQEAKMFFYQARRTDRSILPDVTTKRNRIREAFAAAMEGAVLCLPSVPQSAPRKGFIAGVEDSGDYYARALSLLSVSCLTGAPCVSLPMSEHEGLPLGVSFIGAPGTDRSLIHWLYKSFG